MTKRQLSDHMFAMSRHSVVKLASLPPPSKIVYCHDVT